MSSFSSFNPANGETVWTGMAATGIEVEQAVAKARAAFAAWSDRTVDDRAAILHSFARQLTDHKEALAQIISAEVGKPHWEALTEVQAMIGKIDISIEAQAKRCGEFKSAVGITRFKPHGVVAVLGPFNFPGHLPNGHIVPALLAGNTVVFKPSELAPAVAENMLECWKAAGLPADVLTIVQGGREVGVKLAAQAGLDALFFTGSARAGATLSEQFASTPGKLLALEMGGNNPLVVHRATNIRAAVTLTLQSAYLTAGQRCTCARRLIVPTGDEGDAFVAALIAAIPGLLVGAASDRPEPFMGPVISARAAESLLEAQSNLVNRGAKLLVEMISLRKGTGLLTPGLVDVTPLSGRPDEEFFGPLLQLIRVPDFDAAIAVANHTAFGLAAGLISDDAELYRRFHREVRAGIINWNQQLTGASSAAPFGGVGNSGNHRPSAYFAADYTSYPVASIEVPTLQMPDRLPPGLNVP